MASSGPFRFYIMTVQDFPFLLVIAPSPRRLLTKRRTRLFFFCLALALATRQVFFVLLPYFRHRRAQDPSSPPARPAAFGAGLFFGFLPSLLYPRSFILNFVRSFRHYMPCPAEWPFPDPLARVSHYFFDRKTMATVLCLFCWEPFISSPSIFVKATSGCSSPWGLRISCSSRDMDCVPRSIIICLSRRSFRHAPARGSRSAEHPLRRSLQSHGDGNLCAHPFAFPLLAKSARRRRGPSIQNRGRLEGTGSMEFSLANCRPPPENVRPWTF